MAEQTAEDSEDEAFGLAERQKHLEDEDAALRALTEALDDLDDHCWRLRRGESSFSLPELVRRLEAAQLALAQHLPALRECVGFNRAYEAADDVRRRHGLPDDD